VREVDCRVGAVERFESTCGGSLIQAGDQFVVDDRWTFDADGKLIGVVFATDVGYECPDGGYATSTTYGTTCDPQGPPEDLCSGAGGAGGEGGEGGAGGGGGGGS
jgi:hypothetical protein